MHTTEQKGNHVADDGNLAKSWEWFGYFSPLGAPEACARPGLLSYTPESGLTLRLIGAFEERVLPAIHGVVERVPVTLVDCVATSTQMKGFDAVAVSQIIDIQSALFGILLSDPDSAAFEALDIELEQLSEWSAEQDMTLRFDMPNGADSTGDIDLPPANTDLSPTDPDDDTSAVAGSARRGWGVRVDPAESRSAQVNDELQIKLGRRYVLPNFDNYRDRIEVKTYGTSVLTAKSGQPRNLREWMDIAHACQDLLSLASYSPCAVLRLTLTTEKGVHKSDNTARKEVHLFIDNVVKGEPDVEGMTPWGMLFNLSDVDFSVLMPRWFEVRDVLGPTCDMVLGLKYIPGGYLETQLLTVVGAAEVMAGALIEKLQRPLPIPREVFPGLRQQLIEQTPEKHQRWVGNKLQNTPTLGDRLMALASIPDQQIIDALLPNPEAWARRTAKARNDLAHRGRSDEVSYPEIAAAVQATIAIVIINLLSQLEIPVSRVLQALEHHPDLKNAPRLARKYWLAEATAETT